VPTGTWLAWSQANDIAGRVAQEWTPAGTALSDGPSAAKAAEVKAYDTGYGTTKRGGDGGNMCRWPFRPRDALSCR
jgi:hypothetical protein